MLDCDDGDGDGGAGEDAVSLSVRLFVIFLLSESQMTALKSVSTPVSLPLIPRNAFLVEKKAPLFLKNPSPKAEALNPKC